MMSLRANHQGPARADDTCNTTEAQDPVALPTYEEGILTPKTSENDESIASSVAFTTGHELPASPNPAVPETILANWYSHMDCLSRLEDWKSQEDVLTNYQNGTGLWVLENPGFKEWLEGNVHVHMCCLYGSGK